MANENVVKVATKKENTVYLYIRQMRLKNPQTSVLRCIDEEHLNHLLYGARDKWPRLRMPCYFDWEINVQIEDSSVCESTEKSTNWNCQ